MKTRIGDVYNAPIAVMDVGTLSEIGKGNRRWQARERAARRAGIPPVPAVDPLTLLTPLMTPGQCTLVIPRFVVQELFTVRDPRRDGKSENYYEYGPTQRSLSARNRAADIVIENDELHDSYPGLCNLLENDPKQVKESNIPWVRYYATPQEFIQNGEVEWRKGGIAIVDDGVPLNESGRYLRSRSIGHGRGDDQIRQLINAVVDKHMHNVTFPVISSDYLFLGTAVQREYNGKFCESKPFPMNLRALISAYKELDIMDIDKNMAEALYSITNRSRDAWKTPDVPSSFRDTSREVTVNWLRALQEKAQNAGTQVSTPLIQGRIPASELIKAHPRS